MKKITQRGRLTRNGIFALIGASAIILLLAMNLILSYFGVQKTLFIDTTPEGLYTLTDAFKEECAFIDEELGEDGKKVKITFCSDPDTLLDSIITKLVYFTALEMQNTFENVEVETVNVTYNPTAVSKYRPTSLTTINPTDVIVSYGDRYKVVKSETFWMADEDQLFSYNGEYKMASLVMSVTAKNRPVAYFATGHGETYYDINSPDSETSVNSAYLYDLLTERGLQVKTVDLTTAKEIPEDCVLLIINNPRVDYTVDKEHLDEFSYISPLEVIDRYLVKDYGSVMVAKDYELTLPNLESYLLEWGFVFSTSRVEDSESLLGSSTTIPAVYETNENTYGYMVYSGFANLASAPTTVFGNTGYISCGYGSGTAIPEDGSESVTRTYEPMFYGSNTAKAYEKDADGSYKYLENDNGGMHLAAISVRSDLDDYTIEYKYSDLFCAASGDFFSNELLGNSSYANYQIVSALTESLVSTEEYASTNLGGISPNLENVGGKVLQSTTIYDTSETYYDSETDREYIITHGLDKGARNALVAVIAIPPVLVLISCAVVFIRRRYM